MPDNEQPSLGELSCCLKFSSLLGDTRLHQKDLWPPVLDVLLADVEGREVRKHRAIQQSLRDAPPVLNRGRLDVEENCNQNGGGAGERSGGGLKKEHEHEAHGPTQQRDLPVGVLKARPEVGRVGKVQKSVCHVQTGKCDEDKVGQEGADGVDGTQKQRRHSQDEHKADCSPRLTAGFNREEVEARQKMVARHGLKHSCTGHNA
mmetsp:Transcript_8769/g.20078  ORF Transcript_8769/g.20078 Transcript_8769/m.20078 type:complete len:204 (-) Transcript_8769:1024-1635(-)